MMHHRAKVYGEIQVERDRQDAQWGGPEHDDQHSVLDWMDFITYQVDQWRDFDNDTPEEDRQRFIKIAALCFAALESDARKKAEVR